RTVVSPRHARLGRKRIVAAELLAVEADPARHDLHTRALEDAKLRGAVVLERPVPVEMVRLEVEEDGDVARKRLDVLELEARELAHDPRPLADGERDLAQGHVLVAG